MRDNPEEGELDPAEGVRRRCKKNSPSVLSCIGKRTREGFNRGSEFGSVKSGLGGERLVSEKIEEIWPKRKLKKDSVSRWSSGCVLSL